MTVSACLDLVDSMLPNAADASVKRRWLTELEGRIRVERLGEPAGSFPALDADSDLLVPAPFDQLYWMYLIALIEYTSGDTSRYANAAALFNTAYQSYAKYLIRSR